VGVFGSNNEFIIKDVYWNAKCKLDLAGSGRALINFLFGDGIDLGIRQTLSLAAIICSSRSPWG